MKCTVGLHWLMWADAKVFFEAFNTEIEGLSINVTGDDNGLVEGQDVMGGLEEVVLWHCFVQVKQHAPQE